MYLKYLILFIYSIAEAKNYTLDIVNINQRNQTNSNISYEYDLISSVSEICVLSNRPITFYINNEYAGNSIYNFQELCSINVKNKSPVNIFIDTLNQLNMQVTLFIYRVINNND